MKKIFKRLENLMLAITFAEAGEHETAREMMKEQKRIEENDRLRPSQRPKKELRA